MSKVPVAPEDRRIAQRPSGGTSLVFRGSCPRSWKVGVIRRAPVCDRFLGARGCLPAGRATLLVDHRARPRLSGHSGEGRTRGATCTLRATPLPPIAQPSGRSLARRGESSDACTRADGDLRLRQRDRAGLRGNFRGSHCPTRANLRPRLRRSQYMRICAGSTILDRRFLGGGPATEETRRCGVL